ncbi:MAG: sigma-70 family RNA polymerase sigma factor [Candidatus Dormibacteraeota bacterium]|uniref:Sigma-70 family RNA polymerase sigma factor n=1 Tax=Candidatus Dormiibacter inghamiae TaxID=3127013 RepID=A0A934K8M5_9BACT|nr:sigma-70 family RNA polymerase sigma factor [Candidatus Dormibacteraeota bacterium]MBJ7605110.1 sigma-70 family RNA polymerase sigma factor [Candidatus Dormibacteraeota bacterium]
MYAQIEAPTVGLLLNRPRAAAAHTALRSAPEAAVERETEPSTEAALLLAVGRDRREDAFLQLYRLYERRLYGLGLRVLGDEGLAEELVQETSLRVWRTAARFDPERGSVSAFIFAIARRLAVDLWRRPSSRPFLPELEIDAREDDDFDQLLLSLTVRDALDSLPDQQRQVLELHYGGDLTQDEIAGRLQIPLGTVKSRTYHALRAFKRAFEERQQ